MQDYHSYSTTFQFVSCNIIIILQTYSKFQHNQNMQTTPTVHVGLKNSISQSNFQEILTTFFC
jgi:hypothetical protein